MTSHLPASILRRRAGRYKPRAWIYLSESEPPTPPSLDYFEHDLRRTKRRGKKSVRRGHVGELRALRFVPLDVLFEIFCHLHPLDLIHLARTSKRLRAILMSRSSIFVWKSALANVEGLPFCPSDLTEPQYTNLAFDEHCHFCLAPNVQQVFWACRVRCCKKCTGKYFISEHDLVRRFPECLDLCRRNGIFPYILSPRPRRNIPGRIMYYLPAAKAYMRELEMISCCESAVAQWSAQKSLEQAARLKHARLCETWSYHWVYRRSQEFNLVTVFFLSALLVVLWREKILEFLAPRPPNFLR